MDNKTCLTFDPQNIDELVGAILSSMKITEEERAEISQKLSTNVRLNFSKNNIPQKVVNIYKHILEEK